MRVILLNDMKDPKAQRFKLVLLVLFLLPVLAVLYYFTADYIASHKRHDSTQEDEIELRAKQAAYSANDGLLEVIQIVKQLDRDAKRYFGPTHEWPEGRPETHPSIMKWVNVSEDTEPLREYHELDASRLALEKTLAELAEQVDQAASRSSGSVASELRVKRLAEQQLTQAIADAQALAASLDDLGAKYLSFKETQ
ncbi:MAG: hypothetical protein KF688_01160 [Pirellulales bacterium]|nr:hypothetical protein [Pirellulales bacterium]